ncbi:hypothetical protein EGW08_003281 [Elysia chlorotica]|uniref:H15 domain-containing protein n=1 Tax=Elysia chlorotica TaxID=188477 RepID=A0A3S0ZX76_ELYCH|nr:hypothetical protein EGW08_003281 [Elysia chlorotica]
MTSPEKCAMSPTVVAPKSPKAHAKKKTTPTQQPVRPKSSNPTLSIAVIEVLKANKGSKGVSLKAIKTGVIELYPDMQENFSNVRLHKAISKGIEEGSIIRPKGSEDAGFTGRFLLNRTFISDKEKEAKQKIKEKEKKKAASEAAKKETKPRAKSPSAPPKAKKDAAKKKTPTKVAAKDMKSPQANGLSKVKKVAAATKASKSPVAKKQKGKSPKTEAKTAGPKTPKTAARKKITSSTPKVSKSATAGAKQKTASAKKLNVKKTAKK